MKARHAPGKAWVAATDALFRPVEPEPLPEPLPNPTPPPPDSAAVDGIRRAVVDSAASMQYDHFETGAAIQRAKEMAKKSAGSSSNPL